MAKRRLNVLFLCTGNSARSIMAEALINRSGRGRVLGFSAGSHPKGFVHPDAIALLRRLRFDTARLRSKSWDEFVRADAPALDVVITVCDNAAGETCPVWPGRPATAHWSIPDPAIASAPAGGAQAFASAFQMLRGYISEFTSLPLARLNDAELRQRLRDIGVPKVAAPVAWSAERGGAAP